MEDRLCDYGCGRVAKFVLKNGKHCCEPLYNKCPAVRFKNSAGVLKAYKDGRLNAKENYQNLPEETKRKMSWNKGKTFVSIDEIKDRNFVDPGLLVKLAKSNQLGKEYKCEVCGNTGEWQGKSLKLEVHHVDGNHNNNDPSNLVFLCPNCHSQTKNYRNRGTSRWLTGSDLDNYIYENLPKYKGNIKLVVTYEKVKNKSTVLTRYIELLTSKDEKLLKILEDTSSTHP